MTNRSRPLPCRLTLGLISRSAPDARAARDLIGAELGAVVDMSEMIDFNYTDYYASEMGTGLVRQWLALDRLVAPDALVRLKHAAGDLEARLTAADGGRTANLDPGLLSPDHLVLASTKPAPHRLFLGDGIWGELTLIYEAGSYRPLAWTYPDYRSETARRFFNRQRAVLLRAPKHGKE